MYQYIQLVLLSLLLSLGNIPWAYAQPNVTVPYLQQLPADLAQVKVTGKPLLILFSQKDCPYCHNVRDNFLRHLVNDPKSKVIVREVQHDNATLIRTSATHTISPHLFAQQMGVKFYPTVILFDSQLRPISTPLLGSDRSGFYGAYLDQNINQAIEQLSTQ